MSPLSLAQAQSRRCSRNSSQVRGLQASHSPCGGGSPGWGPGLSPPHVTMSGWARNL